jgi:hypothetical protein
MADRQGKVDCELAARAAGDEATVFMEDNENMSLIGRVFESNASMQSGWRLHHDRNRNRSWLRRSVTGVSVLALLALILFVAQPNKLESKDGLDEKVVDFGRTKKENASALAMTTSLYRFNRLYSDPRTNLILLQCSDTVAEGSWGSRDPSLINRFQGIEGQRYTVECPTRCLASIPDVFGCSYGPYMDTTR